MIVTLSKPLVQLVLFLCCFSVSCTQIRVSNNGDDSKCLTHQDVPCESLEFVSTQLGRTCSSLTILLEDSQSSVSAIVSFENCTSLKISGKEGSNTKLLCLRDVGFKFRNITNLTLLNMEIRSCGCVVGDIQFNSTAAMHIHRCWNVALTKVVFYNSSFTALVISDTAMDITIRNCSFCSNFPPEPKHKNTVFPSGIHIQLSESSLDTEYSITDCKFQNTTQQKFVRINQHPSISPVFSSEIGYGLGGGMGVLFMNDTQNVTMIIQRCIFANNTAYSGAGLYVHFQDKARGNTVAVIDTMFADNNGTDGGGLAIGINKVSGDRGNYVSIIGSEFINKTARFGGGTLIFALHGNEVRGGNMKLVTFHNCSWKYNSGYYSPAVDIKTFMGDQFNAGYLPTPQFTDCTFSYKVVKTRLYQDNTSLTYSEVFVISSLTVFLGGKITFLCNEYTALKITSGRVILLNGTEMKFISNVSDQGGAIAMYGFSALVGNKDYLLHLDNNSASSVGGGIFYSAIEQREFIEGRSCFLQYNDSDVSLDARNYTLLFTRNAATYGGSSIYATSLYSCFYACHRNSTRYNLTDFQECIGTFKFQDHTDNITAIRTEGLRYHYNFTGPIHAIPGQLVTIPLTLKDNFGHKTEDVLIVREKYSDTARIFANNVTRVFGKPLESGSLIFKTENSFLSSSYRIAISHISQVPTGILL